MTVKELKEELEYYDDDMEVVFEINDDIECESWTEDKWGGKEVHVDSKLQPTFIIECCGKCKFELGVDKDD